MTNSNDETFNATIGNTVLPAVYSPRLEILKKSLIKKEEELSRRLDAHFEDVKKANGQPLNDKRNGQATLNRWERQNEAIRNLKESIEKQKTPLKKKNGK